jgi:hypothetical protein
MIELTEQQGRELKGNLPRVLDPQTKKIYVLVSEEAYEHMQALLAPERLPRKEQQALLHAAGLRAGWDDPEMEIYDREEKELEKP